MTGDHESPRGRLSLLAGAACLSAPAAACLAAALWPAQAGLCALVGVPAAAAGVLLWCRACRRLRGVGLAGQLRAEEIVRHASDGILTTDRLGRLLSINPAAEELFGYPAEEVLGRGIDTLLEEAPHQPRAGDSACGVPVGTVLGVAAGARELLGRRKGGETFPLELAVSQFSLGGEPMCVGFTRDISKRKQAQKHLAAHYAATRALAEPRELGEAVTRILRGVCGHLGWDVGQFWRPDAAAGTLDCSEVYGEPTAGAPAFNAACRNMPLGPDCGLPGRAWKAGDMVWVADLSSSEEEPSFRLAREAGLAWGAGVPVTASRRGGSRSWACWPFTAGGSRSPTSSWCGC
jgi:PAS domain S-box-containing protein